MKLTNFKMYTLMIAAFAVFAFSGCDGTTGIPSDSGISTEIPATVADAAESTVTASPSSVLANGIATSTITVTVKDAASNALTNAAVSLTQTGSSTIGAVTNVGDGTYTFDVTSTTVETETYTATADGIVITQTSDVDFTAIPPPVPDPGTSTVTTNLGSILADGIATSTITVTVKDAASNALTNAAVSLTQTGSSTIGAVTNVGDGTYTFDVTSTTVETETYTATADTIVITQTADVTFTETEEQCLSAEGFGTIIINGKTWLDRNLGASEVAADTSDIAAYGDFYQWGRSAEGHQERTSDTNDTLATTLDGSDVNTAWYGTFIVSSMAPRDWVDTAIDDDGSIRSQSWSTPYDETTNPNQVCPCGYIVPTEQDFIDLNITASNATDTFQLAYAGWRWFDDRGIAGETDSTYFWTSEASSYYFANNDEGTGREDRGFGLSIRCIKP